MSEQDKDRLEIRVRDSLEDAKNTKILQGLQDIISKSEYIKGSELEETYISLTTRISENSTSSRYVSASIDNSGKILYVKVAEKDETGNFLDKVCYANFSKDVPAIKFGQSYSSDQAENIAKQMLESISNLIYSFDNMRKARSRAKVVTDNGIYFASAKYKRKPNSKGNYISEANFTLLINNDFYKAQRLKIFYCRDLCLITPTSSCNKYEKESMPIRLKSMMRKTRRNDNNRVSENLHLIR